MPQYAMLRYLSCLLLCCLVVIGPITLLAQPASPRPNSATTTPPETSASPATAYVPPQIKTFVQATYPKEALQKKLMAEVQLLLLIDATGKVTQVQVMVPVGHGFDQAAQTAAQQFLFIPAQYQGKPVPSSIVYRYRFFIQIRKRTVPSSPPSTQPLRQPPPISPTSTQKPTPIPSDVPKTPTTSTPPSIPSPARPTSSPDLRPKSIPATQIPDSPLAWEGFVLERGTRDPVEGATVYLLGRRFRAEEVTDPSGKFRFQRVPPGSYRIVIPVPNYQKFQQVFSLKRGQKRYPETWYLTRVGAGQFVSVTRDRRKKQEIYRKSLQREEIEIIPGTQGDPLKVLQNLPGMARTPLNTGFFIVRGSAPEDSRVYLDGHQIPALYHFGGLTAVVNADIAKNINLIPGGFSVAYGRSMGGVIEVETRKPSDRWHGYLDVDLIDIGFFLEGPLWKGANLMISARRSHLDFFLGLILPPIPAFDLTVAPRYYDYQIKLDWQVNKKHSLSMMYFGSRDLLTFLRSAPLGGTGIRGEFGFYSMFHRLQFLWRFSPSPTVSHTLSVHAGNSLSDIKGGTTIGFASNTWIISLRDELRWQILKNLSFRAGLDVRLRNLSLDIRLPSNVPREGDLPGSQGANPLGAITSANGNTWIAEPAAYLELDWNPLPSLRMQTGIRFDYASSSQGYTLDPRLNLTWTTPWKPLALVAGVGLFSQPPQLQESSAQFGNPAVQAEHAIHVTLGANVNWTSFFNTEVTFFYKHMYDLIVRSDRIIQRDGKDVREALRNGGIGRAYGLELMIRHKPQGRFFGWISYTLSRSERQDNPGDSFRLFSFDQTHILTLVAAVNIGWGFTFSARFRLVSGNPFTPLRGGIYDADQGSYFPIPGENNSARNPLFHQLDLRLDYKLTFNTWKLTFYVDVQNVYNQPNQEGTTYNYDYTQSAPLTGIPVFPSIGIKGQF